MDHIMDIETIIAAAAGIDMADILFINGNIMAALLLCRSKTQKLRASSSNSLCFLTPGRAKGLIAFGSQWAGPIVRRGLCCRYVAAGASYKTNTTN